jgi:hypothetical protein
MLAATVLRDEVLNAVEFRVLIGTGNPHVTVAKLRDEVIVLNGHHRLFALLEKGITKCPCVVLDKHTWSELGVGGDSFFTEDILFQGRPTVAHYFGATEIELPATVKMIRIPIEEILVPSDLPTKRP